MISLSRHIELLLLEHDCVIVPGLGGFIANHAPARYNEQCDNMFLPPYRSVCFNSNLQTNDGLLVQAYMTAYDASYPAAYKQMLNDIEEALDALDLEGEYELPGIGMLNKDISGTMTFTSVDSGILTPTLYGLYSINIKSKEEAERDKQIQQALQATNVLPIQTEHNEQESKVIALNATKKNNADKKTSNSTHGRLIDIAVACVASVLLFFVFSYPTNHKESGSDTYIACPVKVTPTTNCKPKATVESAVVPTPKEEQVSSTEKTTPAPTPSTEANTVLPEANYTIVLASCVRKDNAEYLIQRLKKAGFPHAVFVKGDNMNRVTYSSYATFNEANKELQYLKKENSLFQEAWVYKNRH